MPFIHFKDDAIEVKFKDENNFLSQIDAGYDIKMEMKQYSNGTFEGSLKTNDVYIILYTSDKLLRFYIGDSTLDVYLTEFQVNKLSGFFSHGVYYELEVPESSSILYNSNPIGNNENIEDPTKRYNNNNKNNNNKNKNNNPRIIAEKYYTRRRKTKQNKSKSKRRVRN
jgi:hypothetical protein